MHDHAILLVALVAGILALTLGYIVQQARRAALLAEDALLLATSPASSRGVSEWRQADPDPYTNFEMWEAEVSER